MASRMKAINHYRPQIKYGDTVGWRDVAMFVAGQSTVSSMDVIAVLEGLHAAIVYYNGKGQGVRLDGLGTYLPNVNYKGEFDVAHRLDRRLKRALNGGNFSGTITNRKHIGKTSEQVVALWNGEHPDDPVED